MPAPSDINDGKKEKFYNTKRGGEKSIKKTFHEFVLFLLLHYVLCIW
jgi:hypothetical protein